MTENSTGNYHQYQLNLSDEVVMFYVHDFNRRYPDDAALVKLVCELYEGSDVCSQCGSFNLLDTNNVRKKKCANCSKYTHLTAGTFFHCQKNLRGILLVIELLSNGIVLSSSRFHRLVGVAQSTALLMIKKVLTVVESTYESGVSVIPTSFFTNIFSRRSHETPCQRHPISEQEVADEELKKNEDSKAKVIEEEKSHKEVLGRLDTFQKKLYSLINKVPVSLEELERNFPKTNVGKILAGITFLEMDRLIEPLPGSNYVRFDKNSQSNQKLQKLEQTSSQKSSEIIMTYIKMVFHGISRKHLRKFVASFWCYFDRDNWSKNELLKACAQFRHIKDNEITQSLTPALMPIPEACLRLPDMFS